MHTDALTQSTFRVTSVCIVGDDRCYAPYYAHPPHGKLLVTGLVGRRTSTDMEENVVGGAPETRPNDGGVRFLARFPF